MLEKLKMLLGIDSADTSRDGVLEFELDCVQELVKSYCHIEEIPATHTNLIVRMAADLYRSEGYGQEEAPRVAQSVTRGDVSVNYGSGSAAAEITGGKSLLDDYRVQLQAIRKLRW